MYRIAWEYSILALSGQRQADAADLTHAGSEGWDLVNVVASDGELQAFLKRPILPDHWGLDDDEQPA